MRVNEKELLSVASQIADKEGRMNYKAPGFREVYKERWFKIKGNLLFYFKLNEYGGICDKEPAGLLIVEHCSIQQDNTADLPFVFTIVFNDDKEKKHTFSCQTEKHCSEWVKHLKESSYEYQRAKLFLVQAKILKITGKDPLAAFPTRKRDQKGSGLQRSMSKTYSGDLTHFSQLPNACKSPNMFSIPFKYCICLQIHNLFPLIINNYINYIHHSLPKFQAP